jgi:hypothetical protein
LAFEVAALGEDAADIAGAERHRVGHVGEDRRDPDRDQGRKGEDRSAAGERVEQAGGEGGGEEDQDIEWRNRVRPSIRRFDKLTGYSG